jgi:hypothetical protein
MNNFDLTLAASMDLSDLKPIEPIPSEVPKELIEEQKKKTVPKRKRNEPALPRVDIITRTINGEEKFVCTYTYRLIEKAVFIPGQPKAGAFANLPIAVSYVTDNCKDEAKRKQILEDIAVGYEQPTEIPRAARLSDLNTFGGKLDYLTWVGDLSMWEDFTDEKGVTVAEWKKGGSKKKRKKAVKPKVERVSLNPGSYVIRYQKRTAGAVIPFDDTKVNLLGADRAIEAFLKRSGESNPGLERFATVRDKVTVLASEIDNKFQPQDIEQLKKVHNKIASLFAECDVYGPAILIVRKSVSVVLK